MFRIILCLFAVIAFAATASAAEYRDPDNAFHFTMPEGWATTFVPMPMIKLMIVSPRRGETGGNCNVVASEPPATKAMTQAGIDAELSGQLNDAFWLAEFAAAKLKNSTIEKSGTKTQHGRNVYFVRATSEADVGNRTIKVTQLQEMQAIPGSMFAVTCTALAEGLTREEADFATILSSFEPLEAPVAMLSNPGPSALTLYERTQFGGVSRVVTQDTPDLARSGWSRAAKSFSVAGAGMWEVCDRRDYAGNCRTVAGAAPMLSGPSGFAALSARHLETRSTHVLSGIAASMASDGLRSSLDSARVR